ncbi:MAG: hypothetical protein KDB79_03760 [Acidobacteria bacterium]|nr:hypothetical protein [Acidobacteriota bacterium]
MKICPKCRKSYSDETLNFCLDDGSILNQVSAESSDPPPTVMMPNAPPTAVNKQFQTAETNQAFEKPPQYHQTKSGSKSWLWVLGILGGVVLLCGGSIIGLIAIGSFADDEVPPKVTEARTDADSKNKTEEPAPKDTRSLKSTIKLSQWDVNGNEYVTARKDGDQLVLTSKDKYYYVILTQGATTYDASVALTLSNTTGDAAPLGYGLIVHSDPKEVLAKDYAFLIRSDTQQYRIARHTNKRETVVIGWTDSSAIKKGKEENVIEVRSDGKDMNFYINGIFIRTEKDFSGYRDGVAGIYTSGDVPIGFSKIEYRK